MWKLVQVLFDTEAFSLINFNAIVKRTLLNKVRDT